MDLTYLTPQDIKVLKQIIANQRNRVENAHVYTQNQVAHESINDYSAPDLYVAKCTTSIPALRHTVNGDIPGVGDCTLYRPTFSYGTDTQRMVSTGLVQRVYNYADAEVAANEYFPVSRTKAGPWIHFKSSSLTLMITAETAKILGPCTGTGLGFEGLAYKVLDYSKAAPYTKYQVDISQTYTLNCEQLNGLLFPFNPAYIIGDNGEHLLTNQPGTWSLCWAISNYGKYYAVSGGVTIFRAYYKGSALAKTQGFDGVYGNTGSITFTCLDSLCVETIAPNSKVLCALTGSVGRPYIQMISACCPDEATPGTGS